MVKYCSNCGKELKDTDEFCGECGTPVTIKPNVSKSTSTNNIKKINKPKESKFNKKVILAIIAIVVVIGIVVVAGGFLDSKTTYEFDDFTLTLPSDYIVVDRPGEVAIFDADHVPIGVVKLNNIGSLSGANEVTIGSHKGYLSEVSDSANNYDGKFIFEENGRTYLIHCYSVFAGEKQRSVGTYDDLKVIAEGFEAKGNGVSNQNSVNTTKTWKLVDTYSGSGTGIENYTIPEGKIKIKISAYPIKNYADNYLYVSTSTGEEVSVDWDGNSAVKTKSDSITFNANAGDTIEIGFYETVNWEVKIYQYA